MRAGGRTDSSSPSSASVDKTAGNCEKKKESLDRKELQNDLYLITPSGGYVNDLVTSVPSVPFRL